MEAQTIPAKYVFLDVVGFTHKRSVEAQTDIVNSLNQIVEKSISECGITKEKIIFLPTGDGLCITLLNIENPFDIHMLIALSILKGIYDYNSAINDEKRQFQVRIGINNNTDNLVVDINGNQNIAGAGINMAARVMSVASGNQIFISQSVYDTLSYRERYMGAFKHYWKTVKHNLGFNVYQFIEENHSGLDVTTETKSSPAGEITLTKFVAHYFAQAIINRDFFLGKMENYNSYEGKLLLWFLTKEAEELADATEVEKTYLETHRIKYDSLDDRYRLIKNAPNEILNLASLVVHRELNPYRQYFEGYENFIFLTLEGIEKLNAEWPDLSPLTQVRNLTEIAKQK